MGMGADLPDGLENGHRCWLEAVEQADLDGYLVVEDVVWIRPGQEAISGPRGIPALARTLLRVVHLCDVRQ